MENRELVEAIHRLELNLTTKLATHTEKLDEHCDKLDTIFEKLERLDRTVYGVGGPDDGLATRMKVMEGHEETRRRTLWGIATIAVPGFLKSAYDFFLGH